MQFFYEFDVKEFSNDKITDLYLNYLIDHCQTKQKDIIDELEIPHATFTRAKKKGFSNNPRVSYLLCKYFNISKYNEEDVDKLNYEANFLFTYIYYNDASKQQESFERLLEIYQRTKGTVLEILTLALISIAMNVGLYKDKDNILEKINEKRDLFECIVGQFCPANKIILLYSLYEYAFHIKDMNLTFYYGSLIEPIIPSLPEKLQVMMNFAIMDICFFSKDFLKGIIYANKVVEAQNKYFSPVFRVTAIYALTTFYSMLQDYDKIILTAENEVLYLQFDEEHQLQYFAMITSLLCAYLAKEDFKKAQELIEVIKNYNLEDHPKLNKAYYPVLNARKNNLVIYELYTLYRLKDKSFNDYLTEVRKSEDKELLDYAKMIEYLYNNKKNGLKKLEKMLEEKRKNNMLLGFSNISFLINRDFKRINL